MIYWTQPQSDSKLELFFLMQLKKKYYDKGVQFFYHFKALPQKKIWSSFGMFALYP